eukprot:Blabericola_migrator_1__5098@NODE_2639_length_2500_cov_14_028360_g737_i1_p2_GENE_NODE_2639_length_2500_cov_14_028360_g737_i1NODE_2639_length_2500_cov_14_028360_g737_i1_p2_ORF_typecomplete_len225_score26_08RT_RNaseH/PF17917_1/8_5e23RT_RNaseH_2/PF17919_1/3_4e22_NODE_2639_length_2500_cov_14_028360_g737_i14101084
MGLMNFVRKYVPRFFERAKTLNRLLRKGKIDWIEEAEEAFQEMERLLTSKPLLLDLPVDGVEFVLDCDASGEAVGGMLLQYLPNGEVRVIGYASTVSTEAKGKWHSSQKEAYAVVFCIQFFVDYLWGQKFTVSSDNWNLLWIWTSTNRVVQRWAVALSEFNFRTQNQSGKLQGHVDTISRWLPPLAQFEPRNEDRLECASLELFGIYAITGEREAFPSLPSPKR